MNITDIPIGQRYGRYVFTGAEGNARGIRRTSGAAIWSIPTGYWEDCYVVGDETRKIQHMWRGDRVYSFLLALRKDTFLVPLDSKLEPGDIIFCADPNKPSSLPEWFKPALVSYFSKTARQLVTENSNVFAVARPFRATPAGSVNTASTDQQPSTAPIPFYLVMRVEDGDVHPTSLLPHKKHPTLKSAGAEAERLAGKHPGASFAVLEPRGICKRKDPCEQAWNEARKEYSVLLKADNAFRAGWDAAKKHKD